MSTSKLTSTLLTALLLAGSVTLLEAQNSASTCPLGTAPAYRGGGLGQGRRAGQGMGQRQRQGVCDSAGPRCAGAACPLGQTAQDVGEITPADANNILFMKQEEKLAHDVYQALAEKWQHATFVNIAAAEQRHMDAVDRLIQAFRLTDATSDEVGKFSILELQALYDELLAKGNQSLADALAVGVLIEETDIEDLDQALAVTENTAVSRVLTNLRRGSSNHLAAFTRALGAVENGGTNPGRTGVGSGRRGGPRQGMGGNQPRGGR